MKLLRLDLIAFGSLKGASLDFASDRPCLEIVYGANEAGKSTALRAISGLFYGIPETTPDVHSIKGPELRVAALVRDARGRERQVVRRKGRKDTLRSIEGEVLEGAEASWLSAGVVERTFHSLFGLSFATLHEGADELLGSAGDLGQSLFSAAVGGRGVRTLIDSLRYEAEQLFKPRGQNQKLNAALRLFEDAKKRSREQAMQASAFTEQQAAIDAAELEVERLQTQHLALRTERGRLERARRVLPLLAKQRELLGERRSLAESPLLPDHAPDERRAAEAAGREASLQVDHVRHEIALQDAELALLSFDPDLAALEPAVLDALRDRLGGYRRSRRELPRRKEALARARDEVARAAARLG
ncbi:MAG TPA: AAA family ATPase, partial [Polyangiales bacterium]